MPENTEAATLHQQIMNLPCNVSRSGSPSYVEGFRDARHAAAELVLASAPIEAAQTSARPPDATPDEWVDAVRQVYLSARASPTTGRIPSSWLEFMRDKLLSSAPPAAATLPNGRSIVDTGWSDMAAAVHAQNRAAATVTSIPIVCERCNEMGECTHAPACAARAALSTPTEGGELPVGQIRTDIDRTRVIWFDGGNPMPHGTMLYARPTPAAAAGVPPGLIRDLLTAADLLSNRWKASNHAVSRRLLGYVDALDMLAASGAPAEPVGINGLTEAETSATASVMGLVGSGAPAGGSCPSDNDFGSESEIPKPAPTKGEQQ